MMYDNPSVELHVTYGDWPSQAWLRSDQQFVLLKGHTGAIRPSMIALARAVLADVDRLSLQLAVEADDGAASQELKLRGICFDAAHHNLVLHLQLLHERSVPPARSVEKLRAAFAHAECHYGGQLGMVEVALTPVNPRAKDYDPLDDAFYAAVRLALDWQGADRAMGARP